MSGYDSLPPQPTRVSCVSCGYDLSGSTIGGFCPECGTAVELSIRRQTAEASSGNGKAITCMVLGIVSLAACGLIGPVAIVLYYKARNDIDRGLAPASSLGMAKAGLICGWIGTGLAILQILVFGLVIAETIIF